MKNQMTIELVLHMDTKRDQKLYRDIRAFAKKHAIANESDALKAFMTHLHFLSVDINTLAHKIKDIHAPS